MPVANYVFTETSPAAAGTAASSQPVIGGVDNGIPNGVCGLLGDYEAIDIIADLKGATGGALDVYVQNSPDEGVSWYDIIHFQQLAPGGALVSYQAPISNATTTTAPILVGKNLTPALAPGQVVNGAFSDRLRLVMVAGVSTTAGAPVVVRICPQRARIREGGEST
jgi:hypothetical protein